MQGSAIRDHCSAVHIQWHFSPERAPHFGGLWEAAVKSTKYHLRRIAGDHRLTPLELANVLSRIEGMLNSRPLMPLYSHSSEAIEVLTPGHFLIGKPMNAIPKGEREIHKNPSLLKGYEFCEYLVREFWERWSREYLQTLQQRGKWTTTSTNVKVGDIVLIREDGTFTQTWPMARVIDTFPGKDGLVRAVLLKTAKSTFRRPITKISILVSPTDEDEDQNEGDGLDKNQDPLENQ